MIRNVRIMVMLALVAFPVVALAQAAGFVATVTAESTDLRQKAADSSPSLDTVLEGTRLPAFGLSPDKQWVRVQSPDGSTVWVARKDVKVAKAGSEPAPQLEISATPTPNPKAPVARITPPPKATPAPTKTARKNPNTL